MRLLIPIVNLKTDPTNIVFPNSYINNNDFQNMKSVADNLEIKWLLKSHYITAFLIGQNIKNDLSLVRTV